MTGDAFWLSSPSSFNVGLDSPQLAAAQVTLAALAPWWEQWQTIVLWSAGLFAHLLLLAGARVETRTTGHDRRCLTCQSSTRFPISAPYQCGIDGESELRTRADVPSNSSRFRIILANEQSDECIG
ncbi:hypothetical protein CCUS01_11893 [Colletotrichum cuscutae]|uniref:Uncharacterized protein n=1 Tax=Colletotrichum cuscutae TaxID=1209917 RepID=A0AAI9XG14_9PEZI|nr:hypothetical protein CCUS01_11893 [Colletotrichum cuscutae]